MLSKAKNKKNKMSNLNLFELLARNWVEFRSSKDRQILDLAFQPDLGFDALRDGDVRILLPGFWEGRRRRMNSWSFGSNFCQIFARRRPLSFDVFGWRWPLPFVDIFAWRRTTFDVFAWRRTTFDVFSRIGTTSRDLFRRRRSTLGTQTWRNGRTIYFRVSRPGKRWIDLMI